MEADKQKRHKKFFRFRRFSKRKKKQPSREDDILRLHEPREPSEEIRFIVKDADGTDVLLSSNQMSELIRHCREHGNDEKN